MSQRSVVGRFGERALERIVSKDTFVPATVKGVVISRRAVYYSGSIGAGVEHTGTVSYLERQEERDRRVRDVGVDPGLFIKLNVNTVRGSILISVGVNDIPKFGGFQYLNGSFLLDVSDVEVKVTSDTVTIRDIGSFHRAGDVRDTMSYSSWRSQQSRAFDRGYECGEVAENGMKTAWAMSEGIHSSMWRVANVDESDYSNRVTLTCEREDLSQTLDFSISMSDWDENSSVRKLIEGVAGGVPENLEEEDVWVSLEEYSSVDPVAENNGWYLYCEGDQPNIVSRTFKKHF